MPAKKSGPTTRPRWQDRAARSLRAHPWITWGTAASIAAVIGVVVPGVAWFMGHFQTVEAAEAHERKDERQAAEVLYGQARIEALILRNRVNDCEVKAPKGEARVACAQYQREYREAEQRAMILYEQTHKATK